MGWASNPALSFSAEAGSRRGEGVVLQNELTPPLCASEAESRLDRFLLKMGSFATTRILSHRADAYPCPDCALRLTLIRENCSLFTRSKSEGIVRTCQKAVTH